MAELTELNKWTISLMSALLFVLISAPFMYKLTNSLTTLVGWTSSSNGCPNWGGLLLHAVVFAVLIRLLMLVPTPGVEKYGMCRGI